MIGIKAIASYVPTSYVDNVQQAGDFDETEEFVREKIGALRLPRKAPDQDTSDLAALAVHSLLEQNSSLKKSDLDAIVVITQNPDEDGLPHTAAIVQKKLQLRASVAAFDVSLGCSGYVYGLYILKGFLEASGLKNGILITADPYSKIIDPADKATSLLFGDAATATWLSDDPEWRLGTVSYGTDGEGAGFLKLNQKRLYMNGRQVFGFALTKVASHVRQVLAQEHLEEDEVDLYCLHQGSGAIVDAIAKNFGALSNRFVKELADTGNTVSSSIPLLLEKRTSDPSIKRILISGFGVGFSWATAVITKLDKGEV